MHFSLVWSGKCTMGVDWFFSEDLGFCCFFEDQYHIGRGHISAGMGRDLYKLLQQRANQWYSLAFPDFFLLARDNEDWHCYLHQKKLQSFLSSQFHLTDLDNADGCSPLFVLPLRKGNGFVSILVQGMAFQLEYEQSFCKYLSSVLPGLAVFAHSRIYEILRVGEGIVTTMADAVKVTIRMRMNRM
jgi:hypothetical protein